MNSDSFLVWLGSQLRDLEQHAVENGRRFDAAHGVVQTAIEYLGTLSRDDRNRVLDALTSSARTHMIGEYRLPYDIRDHIDFIEGILGTLEGYLEQ